MNKDRLREELAEDGEAYINEELYNLLNPVREKISEIRI